MLRFIKRLFTWYLALGFDSPDPPDPNPGAIANAQASEKVGMEMARIAQEQLDWAKERAARSDPLVERVVQQAIDIGEENRALSQDYADYMKDTFRPVEKEVVKRAIEYNLPEEQEREAGKARGTVAQQFDVQRGVIGREMSRYGFDPSRFAAINARLGAAEAASSAGAANDARDKARTYGHALLMDAASLGRNLPSAQATSAGVALAGGNSAATNQLNSDRVAISGADSARGWYQGATNAFGTAGNIYGQDFNARMSGYNASMNASSANTAGAMSAIGAIAGAAIMTSDRRLKIDVEHVGYLPSGLRVYEYTLFGERQRGVMADEVEAVFPELVSTGADGYKRVNYAGLR